MHCILFDELCLIAIGSDGGQRAPRITAKLWDADIGLELIMVAPELPTGVALHRPFKQRTRLERYLIPLLENQRIACMTATECVIVMADKHTSESNHLSFSREWFTACFGYSCEVVVSYRK